MMKNKNASLAVHIDTPNDLGAELRSLAAAMPGLKAHALAVAAIREGLPHIKRKIIAAGAKLAADDE